MPSYETDLYRRIHSHLKQVGIVDCHEHLQRDSEFPPPDQVCIGRFFAQYANCDLISAGMPPADMAEVQNGANSLSPVERWRLLKPWYEKAWNTAYCEALRIALRDLYGVEDFSDRNMDALTDIMRKAVVPGFTRKVFDRAGIDFAMNNVFGPKPVFHGDLDPSLFVEDMRDAFSGIGLAWTEEGSAGPVTRLDDYLQRIDSCFDRYARQASAFKVGRAYDRTLLFEDAPRPDAEAAFNRILAAGDNRDPKDQRIAEDFIMHYLCRKCGEHDLRMKFHTGIQEGNGNVIANSRAALMTNLFLKYPATKFDIYHISYPYQEELAVLAKNFPNVTVDFCWMWVINPAAGRRALSDMLDSVPANKIHGFGGDYIFVEGSYGHAVMARREIARVLADKVEEGRFTEAYALRVGEMLLRENALENFNLRAKKTG